MDEIILYSTHCPKCIMLEKRLNVQNIKYEINDNIDTMLSIGITSAPMLSVNGRLMNFGEAWKWTSGK